MEMLAEERRVMEEQLRVQLAAQQDEGARARRGLFLICLERVLKDFCRGSTPSVI